MKVLVCRYISDINKYIENISVHKYTEIVINAIFFFSVFQTYSTESKRLLGIFQISMNNGHWRSKT